MGEREGTSLFTTATTHVGQWRCKIVVMRSWVKTWTVQKIKTQSDNVMNVHDPDPPHFTVASWTILTPILLNTFFVPECCCLHICRILKVGYVILVKSFVFCFLNGTMLTKKVEDRLICSCESDIAICSQSNWCLRLKLIWQDSVKLIDLKTRPRNKTWDRGKNQFACSTLWSDWYERSRQRNQMEWSAHSIYQHSCPLTLAGLLVCISVWTLISALLTFLKTQWSPMRNAM